jgi:hypothetical protein
MMKKALPLIVLLAMTLVGLSSCQGHYYDPGAMGGSGGFGTGGFGGGGGSGGKSKLDPEIVGRWYANLNDANAGGNNWVFEITADGIFKFPPGSTHGSGGPFTCTTSRGKLELFLPEVSGKEVVGSAKYTIEGNKITFSEGSMALLFVDYVTTYYKG